MRGCHRKLWENISVVISKIEKTNTWERQRQRQTKTRTVKFSNRLQRHLQCPAGRVFQYWVGSGRVLDKIPGSGSGSGRVGVSKYTIGYSRVFFLLSGIS